MLKKLLIAILPGVILLSSIALSQEIYPVNGWQISTPEEQGLDPSPLDELKKLIVIERKFPNVHSVLIVRNGYLVSEDYFGGFNKDRLHMLQSVSKSFTSAIMGIAIEKGIIKGVDEKILDFFPDIKEIENLDDRKKEMSLKDLLTMRSGTDYNENGSDSPHYRLNALNTGWDRFYLDRPMVSVPGTRYQYDSGGVILMSAILKNLTGMHADEFMEENLFKPLEIEKKRWFRNQEGHPHTGGGLNLTPRDMAKFGLLYLRKGKWGDRQIVPEWWVEESFRMHVEFGRNRWSKEIGYGYLWWIQPPDPDGNGTQNIYAARGAYGQFIFIIPEYDMVVVVTGRGRTSAEYRDPILFLYSHILKTVHH
ncbi:serine hydrolase domain-containing protein [candidate division KSB1 bacterium]